MVLCDNRTPLRKNELHGTCSSESSHFVRGSAGPYSLSFQVLAFPASIFSMLWVWFQCLIFIIKAERESLCGVLPTVGTDLSYPCLPMPGLKWEPPGPWMYSGAPCRDTSSLIDDAEWHVNEVYIFILSLQSPFPHIVFNFMVYL